MFGANMFQIGKGSCSSHIASFLGWVLKAALKRRWSPRKWLPEAGVEWQEVKERTSLWLVTELNATRKSVLWTCWKDSLRSVRKCILKPSTSAMKGKHLFIPCCPTLTSRLYISQCQGASLWGFPPHCQWSPGTGTCTRYVSRAQGKMLSVCTTVKLGKACLKLIVPAVDGIRGEQRLSSGSEQEPGTAGSQRNQVLNPSQSDSKTCSLYHHTLLSSNVILDSLDLLSWGLL